MNPLTAYGIAKYAAGKLSTLLCTSYGICHIWARIFSVYGINDNDGTLIRYAVEKLMCGEKTAFTKGEQAWDYLYEADAGEAFYLMGEKAKENKVYCLGSGIARPLKEYIMEIRNLAAPQAVLGLGEISSLNAQPMSLQADISQLTKDTGFHPRVPFQEGITEIIQNWFPTHPV
ncbi:MAG: NAD-dependent epimerase/dehydratase family protein, partial [Oscillospiraceae bacterium]